MSQPKNTSRRASLPLHYVGPLPATGVAPFEQQAEQQKARVIHVGLGACKSQKEVLHTIGNALHFPAYFGANLDALYDCLTDSMVISARPENHGVLMVLHQLSTLTALDTEQRELLLDVFRDAADFHANSRTLFQVLWD